MSFSEKNIILKYGSLVYSIFGVLLGLKLVCKFSEMEAILILKIIYISSLIFYFVWLSITTTTIYMSYYHTWTELLLNLYYIAEYCYTLMGYSLLASIYCRLRIVFDDTIFELSKPTKYILAVSLVIQYTLSTAATILSYIIRDVILKVYIGLYIPYFALSTILVVMFVRKLKELYVNTDNNIQNCNPVITQLTIKFTILAVVQYSVTVLTMFVYVLTVHIFGAVYDNIYWITMYYMDVFVNMICLYLQYKMGNNDYNKYCKYCIKYIQKKN